MADSSTPPTATEEAPEPVIIELGARSKRQIERLRQGRGRIMRDIEDTLGRLRGSGNVRQDAQVVVVVVKQRREVDEGGWCWW